VNDRSIPNRLARAAAVLAFALGLAAAPAMAQQQFSEQQLDAFAETVVAVNPLIMDWNQKIQAAQSEQEKQQLAEQARAQVVSAIEDGGLSVETYNQIAQAAQNDPELRQDIQARLPEPPEGQQ